MPSLKQKSFAFIAVALAFSVITFSFAIFHNEDGSDTVAFLLTDQDGQKTTHKDLSDTSLLVFFGFTSCDDICPISMVKLANVMGAKKIPRINQARTHRGEHGSAEFLDNYQLAHSSVVYLVDTYSRVVEYISLDEAPETIINGLVGKEIDGVGYAAPMPAFGATLSDEEIAAVVNHERKHWNNNAPTVTAADVAALR